MPRNAEVHVRYGVYDVAGIVKCRKHRLQGLEHQLMKEGHTVIFEEVPDIREKLWIIVNGEEVFTCSLLDLQFDCDGVLDKMVEKIAEAVDKAY
ncbi:unnamed protein product [Calicophoron daubneyi]|uniref:Uncharacterized protein n=1 Tax=Calicophoron daubneyi TaxID=300641 RepID=A0AAV2T655_CALDB